MSTGDGGFYAALPTFERFVDVHDPQRYTLAPQDWDVVVTDVEGSTRAIEAGRYKDVNALGVASIVALRNAVPDVDLPFVFGGDGATVLTPAARKDDVHAALRGIRAMARSGFDMSMRASLVSVGELAEAGHEVRVARFGASKDASFAMFAGSGLSEAERRIKDTEVGARYAVSDEGNAAASFDGFECRWRPLSSRHGKVVSVLVQATAEDRGEASAIYRAVLEDLSGIVEGGRPVAPETLNLATETKAFDVEARIQTGRASGLAFAAKRQVVKAQAVLGQRWMDQRKDAMGFPGDVYREEVTANSDFRKFDDTLRMVLDLSDPQHQRLEADLARHHGAGTIVYGTHVASAALITCAIGSYRGNHVHFVDGADGGYALAAKQLKAQRKAG